MPIREWIFVIVLGVLAALFEVAVATFFRAPWSGIQPVLFISSLALLREHPTRAVVYAIVAGSIIDAFAVQPLSFALFRFVIVVFFLWFITSRVLTNHSLYVGIALVFLARFTDRLLLIGFQLALNVFGRSVSVPPLWPDIGIMGLWDSLFVVMYFMLSGFISRRFVSVSTIKVERYG